jgi:hypothetical protein
MPIERLPLVSIFITANITTNLIMSSRAQAGLVFETLRQLSFSGPELYINAYGISDANLYQMLWPL